MFQNVQATVRAFLRHVDVFRDPALGALVDVTVPLENST